MTIDEQKFIVWALSHYDMAYCFDHMDEVLDKYLEETEDENSRNTSNK